MPRPRSNGVEALAMVAGIKPAAALNYYTVLNLE